MKIVTLSSKDIFGGAAKVAYRLHKSLSEEGVDNLFLVNNKRSQDPDVIKASSYYSPASSLYTYIDRFLLKYNEKKRVDKWKPYYLAGKARDVMMMDLEVSLLRDALDNLEFDLLQMHWVGESFVNFTEFKNIKQPVVWTLHDCFAFTGICTHFEDCYKFTTHCGACPQLGSGNEKDLSFEVFEQKLERYKNIDFHIVCPSNWLAESAKKSQLLSKYPITVIPNGIDTSFFYPISKQAAKEALGIDSNKKVILFGGVAIERDTRKGGALLVKALEEFKKNYSENDIELLVFGASAVNIDFGYKTTLLGYVESEKYMRIIYSAADVCIVPSMYENLPTVIMESLSCETPVAAFNIGGNSDMVDHKENGYLAEAYDTVDLANGIKYCLENNSDNILGKNARKKILNNFRIEDITSQYIKLYKQILKQ